MLLMMTHWCCTTLFMMVMERTLSFGLDQATDQAAKVTLFQTRMEEQTFWAGKYSTNSDWLIKPFILKFTLFFLFLVSFQVLEWGLYSQASKSKEDQWSQMVLRFWSLNTDKLWWHLHQRGLWASRISDPDRDLRRPSQCLLSAGGCHGCKDHQDSWIYLWWEGRRCLFLCWRRAPT